MKKRACSPGPLMPLSYVPAYSLASAESAILGIGIRDTLAVALARCPHAQEVAMRMFLAEASSEQLSAVVVAARTSGTMRAPPWADGLPASVLESAFEYFPASHHLTTLERVCRSWRAAGRRGAGFRSIRRRTHGDWLSPLTTDILDRLAPRLSVLRHWQLPLNCSDTPHSVRPALELMTLVLHFSSTLQSLRVGFRGSVSGLEAMRPALAHLTALGRLDTLAWSTDIVERRPKPYHLHLPLPSSVTRLALSASSFPVKGVVTLDWPVASLRVLSLRGPWSAALSATTSLEAASAAAAASTDGERICIPERLPCLETLRLRTETRSANGLLGDSYVLCSMPMLSRLNLRVYDPVTQRLIDTAGVRITALTIVEPCDYAALRALSALTALQWLSIVVCGLEVLLRELKGPDLEASTTLSRIGGLAALAVVAVSVAADGNRCQQVHSLLNLVPRLQALDLSDAVGLPSAASLMWRATEFRALRTALCGGVANPVEAAVLQAVRETLDTDVFTVDCDFWEDMNASPDVSARFLTLLHAIPSGLLDRWHITPLQIHSFHTWTYPTARKLAGFMVQGGVAREGPTKDVETDVVVEDEVEEEDEFLRAC